MNQINIKFQNNTYICSFCNEEMIKKLEENKISTYDCRSESCFDNKSLFHLRCYKNDIIGLRFSINKYYIYNNILNYTTIIEIIDDDEAYTYDIFPLQDWNFHNIKELSQQIKSMILFQ